MGAGYRGGVMFRDKRQKVVTLAGALLLLFGFSETGTAQTYGEITGTVTDSTGAVVAGANVTVTNTATSVARKGRVMSQWYH